MAMTRQTPVSVEEQERRRAAIQEALAQLHLEFMEPDSAIMPFVERFIRGEITINEALAAYARMVTDAR